MACDKCGRETGHYLNCEAITVEGTQVFGWSTRVPPRADGQPAAQCAREGCTNETAISKGPRPTKFCEKHKTGSKA